MTTRRELRRQLDDTKARMERLVSERDDATKAAETERFNTVRLAGQLTETRDELNALREKHASTTTAAAPGSWEAERRDLRRELLLTQRANAQLTDRLEKLQAANEAKDHPGTHEAHE